MSFFKWISLATAAMAVNAITPTQLISAPRRGEAVPNSSGKTAIFRVSQYDFEEHAGSAQWNTLDVQSGKVRLLTDDSNVSEVAWVDDKTILYVNGTNADIPGGVELWVTDVKDFTKGYKAVSIPAPLGNLKIASHENGITYLLSGKAYQNGTAYNPESVIEPYSTARVYDQIMVRHWDTWLTDEKPALFSGSLNKSRGKFTGKGEIKNISGNFSTPVGPFGGAADYSITPDGKTVAFLAKAPELPMANYTASYIYLVPSDGSAEPEAINAPTSEGTPENARGASATPSFSPDGKFLAYLQMDDADYESDRNKLYVANVKTGKIQPIASDWDRSSASVGWSHNGKTLYLQAEEFGREKMYSLPANADENAEPKELTTEGYVGSFFALPGEQLLLTNSSLISSSGFYRLDTRSKKSKPLLEPYKIDPELKGLDHSQVSDFWFQGNETKVHGFMVKPTDFDPSKKYPLAFLIHGGPQSSWANSWSTRWNPAVFADQGYVAVAINPTGSTGYGEKFTDRVQNNWGGTPYEDLVLGFDYVTSEFDFIDGENAVAAGASYGGYMINWIQGHDLGRKFKALVCHDGVFSTLDQYTTEELWFMQHDFNGTLWDNRENYERWDPARHIKEWSTPELVIHNDLDFRLPVSIGLALFNVLQSKGVPSRFLNFPDENHWVLNQENSLVWNKEVLGWINKWTGTNNGEVKL